MKVLKEYDQELLSSALHDLKKVYEYNYSQSSHDKVSRRLETIMKKIEELKTLETESKPERRMTNETYTRSPLCHD